MKALFDKYFRISDQERITDKKMMFRVFSAVTIILLCLSIISLTALAYFTSSVESGSNTVAPATFYVVYKDDQNRSTIQDITDSTAPQPQPVEGSVYRAAVTLKKCDTATLTRKYQISLKKGGTAETGFCKITIGDREWYTRQLGTGLMEGNQTVDRETYTFQVTYNSTEDLQMTIEACWGSYSGLQFIEPNGSIVLTS